MCVHQPEFLEVTRNGRLARESHSYNAVRIVGGAGERTWGMGLILGGMGYLSTPPAKNTKTAGVRPSSRPGLPLR